MVSVVMFIAAILLFMGLFTQTIQTATLYQQHNALATQTSDLLDNMLLSSGAPSGWVERSFTSNPPSGFGLRDEALSQYQLDPFSLMRLESSAGKPVNYSLGGPIVTYNNVTMSLGEYLLAPQREVLNYSYASKLLGVNGSYGFSLTLAPTVTVGISAVESQPTLTFHLDVNGTGGPFANALVVWYLVTVSGQDAPNNPVYSMDKGASSTDAAGKAVVSTGVDVTQKSYALIVSASLSGLSGVGYYSNSLYNSSYVVPLVSNFETGTVNLAHSYGILDDAGDNVGDSGTLYYNATFLPMSDMTKMSLNNGTSGSWVCGSLDAASRPMDSLVLDTRNLGVLVVAYSTGAIASGVVVMPWGFSSLGFSVTFGGQPGEHDWVSTDLRQVLVNNVPYQAKLLLWSNAGHQVIT
jgi:hypothetical protein